MTTKTLELLARLQDAAIDDLLRKIEAGEATAADLGVARQFLKDNGINAVPKANSGLDKLRHVLPFPSAQTIAEEAEEAFH